MVELRKPLSPCSHSVVLNPVPWVVCVCVRVCYRGSTSTSLLGCALVSAP